ncbi:MAG: hypothetical protein WAW85_11690 [Gordonia sp. (in: high G+C Gram-positive bacteria)]|uniref:hypothetical protein n=1 Tax=Gordonia sp. (in: high G+C Gram-positive bacteria) TaxID=84139 RepID=UPI003BB5E5EA
MSVADDEQFPQVSAELLAPGPGRDWFIANRLRVSTAGPVDPAMAPKVLGYRVTDYKKGVSASVDIFTELPDGSMSVNHTTVAWAASRDWALVVPEPTQSHPRVEAVDTLPPDVFSLR